MLTLEAACRAFGVTVADVLSHRIYADRVVVVLQSGAKLTYTPEPETTEVVTTAERAPSKRRARGMSADISEAKEADNA